MVDASRLEDLPASASVSGSEGGDPARHVAIGRVGEPETGSLRSAVVVALLLGIAIVKPWSVLAPAAATSGPDTAAEAASPAPALLALVSSAPAPTPTPLPAGALPCEDPTGWRLVTLGWLASWQGAARFVVEPASLAVDPRDPRIPILPVGQAPVLAVGACRPRPDPATTDAPTPHPPPLIVAAWRIETSGPVALRLFPYEPRVADSAVVQLYRLDLGTTGGGDWGPGRYVVEVETGDLPSPAWMGLTITEPPPVLPVAARAGPSLPAIP